MATKRPRTGERRQKQRTLKLDTLIASAPQVRDAILHLRNVQGRTWPEIAEQSGRQYSEKWESDNGSFVHWDELPTHVLELFPDLRLPQTNLQRWYDLRVRQVMREVEVRSAQARELAAAFAKSVVVGGDAAVLNAARDQLMSLIAEDASPKARVDATKGLIALAEVMNSAKKNELRSRQVTVQEKALQAKLDEIKRKTEKLIGSIESADGKKAPQLTRDELLERVREIYGAV